jgi:hypothetical protein
MLDIRALVLQTLRAASGRRSTTRQGATEGSKCHRGTAHLHADGRSLARLWQIDGAGRAWAGGHSAGSFTDPAGPDAPLQRVRFFPQRKKP